MKLLADASIPGLIEAFPAPFDLKLYHNQHELMEMIPDCSILLCRSSLKVDAELLQNTQLDYIATASSGSDHINKGLLQEKAIGLIDAKGCNADSVRDYVQSTLAYLNLKPGSAGVIGLGAVGSRVKHLLEYLGWKVVSYDPLLGMNAQGQDCLYDCDLLCVHAELHNNSPFPSLNLIDKSFLSQLKQDTVIINAARGGIVNEADWLAMRSAPRYCTDVYLDEPRINPEVIDRATLCTPHIAGHSIEGKLNAVSLVSDKLHRLLGLDSPIRVFCQHSFSTQPYKPEIVLDLYNPIVETLLLKQAEDKEDMFLKLRKAHVFRHDFNQYPDFVTP